MSDDPHPGTPIRKSNARIRAVAVRILAYRVDTFSAPGRNSMSLEPGLFSAASLAGVTLVTSAGGLAFACGVPRGSQGERGNRLASVTVRAPATARSAAAVSIAGIAPVTRNCTTASSGVASMAAARRA
jgi:hypothetical protein